MPADNITNLCDQRIDCFYFLANNEKIIVQWLVLQITNPWTWVQTLVWAVGVQPTWLFILLLGRPINGYLEKMKLVA